MLLLSMGLVEGVGVCVFDMKMGIGLVASKWLGGKSESVYYWIYMEHRVDWHLAKM